MPFKQVWFAADKDETLPVCADLPAEYRLMLLFGAREAILRIGVEVASDRPLQMHYCGRCGGWIPGGANGYHEDTLAPHQLAGRQGAAYYCRRCGREIAFVGMVS